MTLYDLLVQTMNQIRASMGDERRSLTIEATKDRLILQLKDGNLQGPPFRSLSLTQEEMLWLAKQATRIYQKDITQP